MTLTTYDHIEQGAEEWADVRRGIVTASVVHQLVTRTLKVANNDTSRNLILTLAAERITGHTEDGYLGHDMQRGMLSEPYARDAYSEQYEPVTECGFMVREYDGYRIGFSPDGLITDGFIEIKSRLQKIQVQTILNGSVPKANIAQVQCGLLVSQLSHCDFVSYSGGMPLWKTRVYPDPKWQEVIPQAVEAAEEQITEIVDAYQAATAGLPLTERIEHFAELDIF